MAAVIVTGKGERYYVKSCFKVLLVVSLCVLATFYLTDMLPLHTVNHTWQKGGFSFQSFSMILSSPFNPYLHPQPQSKPHKTDSFLYKLRPKAGVNMIKTTTTTTTTTTTPTTPAHTTTIKSTIKSSTSTLASSPITMPTPEDARQYHNAYPRQYHFMLNEPHVCQTQKPFLVLMVPVHPSGEEAREAIRRTWGNETLVQGKVVTTLFLLGKMHKDATSLQERVNNESVTHHDILQSDFLDTYLNLTIKTMLIMDWLATYCPSAAYAMKIDSDMFLNVENLMSMLLMPQTPKQDYITGYMMWDRPVVRDPSSKWYVSEDLYPEPNYPTYLLGMGYLFSNDLPEKLVLVSKDVKPFNIEDAYIGVCLKRLRIKASVPPDPSQFIAYTSGPFKRCDYVKAITTILGSANQLLDYWKGYKKGEPPC